MVGSKPVETDGHVPIQSKIHSNSSLAVDKSLHWMWISSTNHPSWGCFCPSGQLLRLARVCKLLGKQRWVHNHGGHHLGITLTSLPPCPSPNAHPGHLSRAKPSTASGPTQMDEQELKQKSTGWHQRHLPCPSLACHSLQSLRCPSILITVLALVSVTDCKWREARRVQPCKMPQPATHRTLAVASREIWGPASHLYPQEGPCGAASSPYLPKDTLPQVSTSHLGTAMASPCAAHPGYGTGPPILFCPSLSGLPSPYPILSCRNKYLQAQKQPGEGGGPREQEGCLFADSKGFLPQI